MKNLTTYSTILASCLILTIGACSSAQKNNSVKPENTPQDQATQQQQQAYNNPAAYTQQTSYNQPADQSSNRSPNQSASNAAIVPDTAQGTTGSTNENNLGAQQTGQQAGQAAMNDNSNSQQQGVSTNTQTEQRKNLGMVQRQEGNVEVPTQNIIVQQTKQDIPTITEVKVGADINRMTGKDFKALGLSDDEAQKVVKYRSKNGPFKSVNDLAKVPDISLSWLASNQSKLAVDQAAQATG